ncbi:formimidoylglutamase [Candidatus Poribacteria bacterium]|nr:formimidoylglutamase [Candidatus Poribacteria bacterium]
MNREFPFSSLIAPDPNLFVGGHDLHDVKLGQAVRTLRDDCAFERADAAILGFPTHAGVLRNHGRAGAAEGPAAIRRALYKLNDYDSQTDVSLSAMHIVDIGDVETSGSLEEDQARLGRVTAALLNRNITPVILGGGHETAYGHFLGYMDENLPVAIVNLDAHLDVRESSDAKPHSGTPFRGALQHPRGVLGNRYTVIGAQPHVNSKTYVRWMREHGGAIHWAEETARRGTETLVREALDGYAHFAVMVTLDMDVVSSAFAPGTSAASPAGITANEFLAAARAAGRHRAVRSLDVVECSPPLDRDGQTARLAALAIHAFLAERLARG